jgi:hypothetical protein
MISRFLHHGGEFLLRGLDGVGIGHDAKVFLFTRNVYTFRSLHSLPGNRLNEPKASYWNLYS